MDKLSIGFLAAWGALALTACGGGGGSSSPGPVAAAPAPATPQSPTPVSSPTPAPSPAPIPGVFTITYTVTAANVGDPIGTIYTKVGTRAYAISELDPNANASCPQGVSPQICSIDVPAGQTVTLVAAEDPVFFRTVTGPNDPGIATSAPREFISWGSGCATPERGACTITPTASMSITAVYGKMQPMLAGQIGLRPWSATLNAPAQVFPGFTATTQQLVISTGSVGIPIASRCGAAADPTNNPLVICAAMYGPQASTMVLATLALPPAYGPPTDNGVPYAFDGFGGNCNNGACTVAGPGAVVPTAYAKAQYFLCPNNVEEAGYYMPVALQPGCALMSP
jgi:hypothetical protein